MKVQTLARRARLHKKKTRPLLLRKGEHFKMSAEECLAFSKHASFYEARERAKSMGIRAAWDCELPKTPEGFYQIQSGIDYAIARPLALAPLRGRGRERRAQTG